MTRFPVRHKDSFGTFRTALAGVTQWTERQYRSTKLVFGCMANADVISYTIQFNHDKQLGAKIDGFHLHYIPLVAATGTILWDIAWGWYNIGDVVPATLPNTVSGVSMSIAAADQYKHSYFELSANMTHPGTETYSSILFMELTRNGGTYGNSNEIAVITCDCHYTTDRLGSAAEYTE